MKSDKILKAVVIREVGLLKRLQALAVKERRTPTNMAIWLLNMALTNKEKQPQ